LETRITGPAPLRWVKPPRQARTQQVLARLLDAAEALLAEKGFDDISVGEVASRADTSVGALYRRLHDKEGLLHGLHERFREDALATADAALDPERRAGAGIAEIVSETTGFLIEVFRDHLSLDRAVYQRAISDARFRERSVRLERHVLDGLSRLLLARRGEIRHPDPERAVLFALRQIFAVLAHEIVVGHEEDGPALSDERLARELTTACLAYLGVRPPDARA